MAAPTLRPLTLGEVLDVAFGLYRSTFATLLVVAVACHLIPTVLSVYLWRSGRLFEQPLLLFGYVLIAWILNSIAVAATTIIVSDAYLGRRTSAGEALRRTGPLLLNLIGISIMSSLLIGLGLILFILPGLYVLAGLVLSSVVMVVESPRRARDAMSRSWELTRGFRGKVFGLLFVTFVLLSVPSIAIGAIWGIVGPGLESEALLPRVLGEVLQVVIYPYFYTVLTLAYYDLRVRKEGFDLEVLATAMQPG
ncbi:MAG TPA: hypothetical protein VGP61_01310 [Gemmatimonadales bacterium]|nr:hypothetical protein [Gemmatimonadales bacterium]